MASRLMDLYGTPPETAPEVGNTWELAPPETPQVPSFDSISENVKVALDDKNQPDTVGETLRISKQLGVPAQTVNANIDQFRRFAMRPELERFVAEAPVAADMTARNAYFYKLAVIDDREQMIAAEKKAEEMRIEREEDAKETELARQRQEINDKAVAQYEKNYAKRLPDSLPEFMRPAWELATGVVAGTGVGMDLVSGQAMTRVAEIDMLDAWAAVKGETLDPKMLEVADSMRDIQGYDTQGNLAEQMAGGMSEMAGQQADNILSPDPTRNPLLAFFSASSAMALAGQPAVLASGPAAPATEAAVIANAMSAGKYAASAAVFKNSATVEIGSAFRQYMELKNPDGTPAVSREDAGRMAIFTGAVGGSLDALTLAPLAKLIPGVDKLLAGKVTDVIAKNPTVRGAVLGWLKTLSVATLAELGPENAQEVLPIIGAALLQDKSVTNAVFSEQTAEQLAEISKKVLLTVGAGGAVISSPKLLSDVRGAQAVQRAEKTKQHLLDMATATEGMRLADRSPETFSEYAGKVMERGGVKEVYLQADRVVEVLAEQGMQAPEIVAWAKEYGVTAEQLDQARITGGTVALSPGALAKNMKTDKALAPLLDDMTVAHNEHSVSAVKEGVEAEAQTQARLAELYQMDQDQRITPDDVDSMLENYVQQLVDTGMTEENAGKNIRLVAARANALQSLTGEPAVKHLQRWGLNVRKVKYQQFMDERDPFSDVAFARQNAEGIALDIENNIAGSDKMVVDGFQKNATVSANSETGKWYMDKGYGSREVATALRKFANHDALTDIQQGIVDAYTKWMAEQKDTTTDAEAPFQMYQSDLSASFAPQEVAPTPLPEDTLKALPSMAEKGQYYHATSDRLQAYLDANGDGFLYRVMDIRGMTDGHDIGLPDYQHSFKGTKAKTYAFSSSLVDVKNLLAERGTQGYIVYRVRPQEVSDSFVVQIPSDRKGGSIHVHSPHPVQTRDGSVDVLFRNGEWLEAENANDARRSRTGNDGSRGRNARHDAGTGSQGNTSGQQGTAGAVNPLLQGDRTPRAAILPGEQQNTILLFEKANLSSFLHEIGHLFLDDLQHVSKTYGAQTKEWEAVRNWWKSDPAAVAKEANGQLAAMAQRKGVSILDLLQSAWHGSPHKFDKFTTAKMGTGEGAQAYGWGMYMTSSREVAEFYRDKLSRDTAGQSALAGVVPTSPDKGLTDAGWIAAKELSKNFVSDAGKVKTFGDLNVEGRNQVLSAVGIALQDGKVLGAVIDLVSVDVVNALGGEKVSADELRGNPSMLIDLLPINADNLVPGSIEAMNILAAAVALSSAKIHTGLARFDAATSDFVSTDGAMSHDSLLSGYSKIPHPSEFVKKKGALYKVELAPAEDEYLLWDRPLSEQSEKVKAALEKNHGAFLAAVERVQNGERAKTVAFDTGFPLLDLMVGMGGSFYELLSSQRGAAGASKYLHSLGIRGIKYLDGTSRGKDEGNYNYVIFHEDDVAISEMFQASRLETALNTISPDDVTAWVDTGTTGNATKDEALRVATHERFARAFEVYLREGTAPSIALRDAFRAFKKWLTRIYRQVKDLDITLTDEMRDVFDRMLATEDEIARAHGYAGMMALLDETYLRDQKATPEEIAEYRKATGQDAARETLDKHKEVGRDARRKEMTAQATKEVDGQKIYGAIAALTRNAEGVYGKGVGISRQSVIDTYGKEVADKLPASPALWRKDGYDIAQAAVETGYEEREFLDALLTLKPREQAIEERTEALMIEHDKSLPTAEAIRTAQQLKQLEIESKWLEKKSAPGKRALARQVIKEWAVKTVAGMPMAEAIRVDRIMAESKKLREKAIAAAKRGDYDKAFDANEKVRLNETLLAEKLRTKEAYRLAQKRWKRAQTANVKQEYADQVTNLLSRFKMVQKAELFAGAPSLKEFILTLANAVNDLDLATIPVFPDWLTVGTGTAHNMTWGQVQDLDDAVSFLVGRGREEMQALLSDQKTAVADAALEMAEASKNVKGHKKFKDYGAEKILRHVQTKWRGYFASLDILLWQVRTMDGFVHLKGKVGPNEAMYRAVTDGWGKRRVLIERFQKNIQPHVDVLLEGMRKAPAVHTHVKTPNILTEDGRGWTHEAVIAAALNVGNNENLQRFMDGYDMTADDVLALTSVLSKEEWLAIQAIWDEVNSLWPHINEVHMNINHFRMKKVEAVPFSVTVNGEVLQLAGGYYPAAYDSALAQSWGEADEILSSQEAIFQTPRAASGMTKSRSKSGGSMPIKLSLSVLGKHLADTASYITLAEPVRDFDRVTRHKNYATRAKEVLGDEGYAQIRMSLKHVVRPDIQIRTSMDKMVQWLSTRNSSFYLGYNFATALVNVTGVFSTMREAGATKMAAGFMRGMSAFHGNPVAARSFILEKSAYMRERNTDRDADIVRRLMRFAPQSKIANARENAVNFGYAFIKIADDSYVIPTWIGVYEAEMKTTGGDEKASIAKADAVVRSTSPSGEPIDKPYILRTIGIARLFAPFFTWAGNQGGRFRYHYRALQSGEINSMQYAHHLTLEWLAPAIAGSLMLSFLRSGEPPEPEKLAVEVVTYPLQGFPVARDLVAYTVGKTRETARIPHFEMLNAAGDLTKGAGQLLDGENSEREIRKFWFSGAALASYATGVPVSQIYKRLEKGAKQADQEGNPMLYIFPDTARK